MSELRITKTKRRFYAALSETLLIGGVYVLFTLFASRVIWLSKEPALVGQDNDVYINLWADWWTAKSLTDPNLSLWYTEHLFYPEGADLTYHSYSHLNTAVSLLLRPLLGKIGAYNAAILLNYPLAALAMYQLGRYVTGSRRAGFLAGIVFAFNSHSLYQSCHPVLVSIWCFPWVTLYLLRAVRENRTWWAALAAGFVFLGAATSTVLLFMLILWSGFLLLYLWLAPEEPRPPWRIVLLYILASGLLALPLNWHLLRQAVVANNTSFFILPLSAIVAELISPLIPHWFFWLSRGIYFGVIPLSLLILARRQRAQSRLWYLLLLVAYLFSIGPVPVLFGRPFDVVLPWSMLIVPILRNTYRLNILIGMALAALAALGWQTVHERLRGRPPQLAWVVWGGTLLLISVEYLAVPFPHSPARLSPFYTAYLAGVADDVPLATIPADRQADKYYLFYQTYHQHPITGGVVSRVEADAFEFTENNALLAAGRLQGGGEPPPLPAVQTALQQLADEGVGFLVVSKTPVPLDPEGYTDFDAAAWRRAIPLRPVYEDEHLIAYDIRPLQAAADSVMMLEDGLQMKVGVERDSSFYSK